MEISVPKISERTTKRSVLQEMASIFFPLGFISPITLPSKILLQKLWREGVSGTQSLGKKRRRNVGKWFGIGHRSLKFQGRSQQRRRTDRCACSPTHRVVRMRQ